MYTHLVALSVFLILSSGFVAARPLRPSPVYQYRRQAAMTPAPARIQPYHPGLAVVATLTSPGQVSCCFRLTPHLASCHLEAVHQRR
jgi:hypothetical protein